MTEGIPNPLAPIPVGRRKVRFHIAHITASSKFGCVNLTKKNKTAFLKKLKYYREMTVAQFQVNGSVNLKQFHNFPEAPPPPFSEDTLALEFYLSGKSRAMGWMIEETFVIRWIDPGHKAAKRY